MVKVHPVSRGNTGAGSGNAASAAKAVPAMIVTGSASKVIRIFAIISFPLGIAGPVASRGNRLRAAIAGRDSSVNVHHDVAPAIGLVVCAAASPDYDAVDVGLHAGGGQRRDINGRAADGPAGGAPR